ncbi:HNH endonuclease signature motif containing protein [Clostridium haemolyticum]|uniref:HNH nuclease domain-containing protein n=1 Tax=Clostridium haemolyticum NCTC 9693 TaxID=1443114 RepID=A0ABR4TGV4_CLOHA|nr:HNH endonuclease signature motif containing protein [Clostridium haemolyticum]KEI18229.1 hypothetical protein Z960_03635 [Clostridium haemolyticum NCTC 9693]KGN03871.1 phage protein [Clostridium haemolyticum NCTC 8350]
MAHVFTAEQSDFIKNNVKGISTKELTAKFNKHFLLNLTINQIEAFKKRHKLKSGLTGQFPKGYKPWNKGIKGVYNKGCEKTWFKNGHKPHNHKEVGSERITADGYTEIKIKEPNKWRLKHHLIWEKHNGPIPKGHMIIFGDGNRANFNINNLILVSKHQLLILNKKKLIKNDANLTRTGILIADIYKKISEVNKHVQK